MATKQKHETHDANPDFYLVIDGRKVFLTEEERKVWKEMINRNRRYARNFGTCGQADYRKCQGDCAQCPHTKAGAFIYIDDHERYGDGFAKGEFAPAQQEATPEERAADSDAWSWLYASADRIVDKGEIILRLHLEDGLSTHQISHRTGIAKSTVNDRLNKLLAFIREHRDDLI